MTKKPNTNSQFRKLAPLPETVSVNKAGSRAKKIRPDISMYKKRSRANGLLALRRGLPGFKSLLKSEASCPVPVKLANRARMWRRGFLGVSHVIYNLEHNKIDDYLPDYHRKLRSPHINGSFSIVLNNKLLFYEVLQSYRHRLPPLHGILQRDTLWRFTNPVRIDAQSWLMQHLAEGGSLVLKPVQGGGGKGIIVLSGPPENALLKVKKACADLDNYMVTERVKQHDYVEQIYAATVNTIRIVTMWDVDEGYPFIAAAVQRIGTRKSAPVDNWTRGGLSAEIDLQCGTIGHAVTYPASGKLEWQAKHPETGAQIEGVTIPRWQEVCSEILQIAGSLPYLPYIGWDVVVTTDGFAILEGNNYTDVNLLQVHRPLLADARIRRFYEASGVL
jgi:hypothetical protein